jgi:hypothetical protein
VPLLGDHPANEFHGLSEFALFISNHHIDIFGMYAINGTRIQDLFIGEGPFDAGWRFVPLNPTSARGRETNLPRVPVSVTGQLGGARFTNRN